MRSPTELGTAIKHPDSTTFYGVEWADVVGSDSISNSDWVAVTDGVTVTEQPVSGTVAEVSVSGGKRGFDYLVKNTITTSTGVIAAGEIRVQVR